LTKQKSGLRARLYCPRTNSKSDVPGSWHFVQQRLYQENPVIRWADLKKSPPKADDADLKDAIACVVKDSATYGCRRVWARLKSDGRQINHKRVCRVMRDEGWLLYRQGQKPLNTRTHEGTGAIKESGKRWCSDELKLPCYNGERVRVAFALDCCD